MTSIIQQHRLLEAIASTMASMSSTVEWERHVRSRITADTPGPHPLDVSPSNADLYTFGGAELVEKELALMPPRFAEEAARVSQELGVRDAFRVRTELINLKKVMLTMHKDSTTIERGLRQAAAFFRIPSDSAHDSFVDRPQLHTQFSECCQKLHAQLFANSVFCGILPNVAIAVFRMLQAQFSECCKRSFPNAASVVFRVLQVQSSECCRRSFPYWAKCCKRSFPLRATSCTHSF